jgi:hypothetical protein
VLVDLASVPNQQGHEPRVAAIGGHYEQRLAATAARVCADSRCEQRRRGSGVSVSSCLADRSLPGFAANVRASSDQQFDNRTVAIADCELKRRRAGQARGPHSQPRYLRDLPLRE